MSEAQASTQGRMLFWNAIGHQVEGAATAAELLPAAGLDFTVETRKIRMVDGPQIQDRVALVRSDEPKNAMAVVSTSYKPISPRDGLDVLDGIVDSGEAKYEAGWQTGGGKKVGVTAKLPEGVSIAGDEHDVYLLLRMDNTGRGGLEIFATAIRLDCTNMVNQAIKGARSRISIPHIGDPMAKIAKAREALGITFTWIDAYKELGEELSRLSFTDAELDAFLEDLTEDRGKRAAEADATGIRRLFEDSPTLEGVPHNGYRLIQSVGEWYDWGRPVRNPEARFIGTTTGLGARQRQRATDMALALA